MKGWAHTITATVAHVSCSECCCTNPKPDPSSLCGYVKMGIRCGATRLEEHYPEAPYGHRHRPTRCVCGHPLERAA